MVLAPPPAVDGLEPPALWPEPPPGAPAAAANGAAPSRWLCPQADPPSTMPARAIVRRGWGQRSIA